MFRNTKTNVCSFTRPLVLLFIVLGKKLNYATKLMTNDADHLLHCL